MGHLRPIEVEVQKARDRAMPPPIKKTKKVWKTLPAIVDLIHSNHTYDVTVPGRAWPYTELHCIIPGLDLVLGQGCTIGFFENEENLAMIIAARFVGKHALGVSSGPWDQAWANYHHGGNGSTLAGASAYPGSDVFSYETDSATPGLWWQPEGLLARGSTGQLWLVHFWSNNDGAFSELRVKLLTSASAVAASVAIPLTETPDRTFGSPSPDSTCFYDNTNDLLHVLRIPGHNPDQIAGKSYGRIWTVALKGGSLQVVGSVLQLDVYTVPDAVNIAGEKMIIGNLSHTSISGYSLDIDTLKWTRAWSKSVASLGGYGAGPVIGHGPNYSAPWWKHKFYGTTIATTQASDGRNTRVALRETAIEEGSGTATHGIIYTRDEYLRADAIKVESVNVPKAAQESIAYGADSHTTETRYCWYSGGGTVGEVPYTHTSDKTWLGTMYSNYSFGMDWVTGIYTNSTITYTFPLPPNTLIDQIGIAPPSCGLPAPCPNHGNMPLRHFWSGQSKTDLPTSDLANPTPTTYPRAMATEDGWRYHAYLRPVPVLAPDLTGHEHHGTESIDREPLAYVASTPCGTGTPYGACSYPGYSPQHFNGYKARQRFGGWVPETLWSYETVICAISPDGAVTQRVISTRYTGGTWPHPDGISAPISIAESLPVPENAWQVVPIAAYGQIAWMIDTRDGVDADPKPTVFVLDAQTLATIYTIDASVFMPDGIDTPFATDQVYSGSTWALAGQYQFDLHGHDSSGPQMKTWIGAEGTPLLLIGYELVQRVEPSTGTTGITRHGHQILALGPTGLAGGISAGSTTETWTWPTVTTESAKYNGPKLVRSMAILGDRIMVPNGGSSAIIKQIL